MSEAKVNADLDPASEALLEQVRAHDALPAAREQTILASLEARHAAGDPGIDLSSGSGALGSGAIAKIVVGLAVVAGIAVPAVLLTRPDPAPAPSPAPVAVAEPEVEPAPVRTEPAPEPTPPPAAEPALAPEPVPERAAEPERAPRPTTKKDEPVPASEHTAPADPRAELDLIQRARTALAAGDARRALSLLDRHEREFPRGVLTEERLVSRAQAHCTLGERDKARKEVAAFLRSHPTSVLRERARTICADDPKKNDTDPEGSGHGPSDR